MGEQYTQDSLKEQNTVFLALRKNICKEQKKWKTSIPLIRVAGRYS